MGRKSKSKICTTADFRKVAFYLRLLVTFLPMVKRSAASFLM
jgi:hypothetical protein